MSTPLPMRQVHLDFHTSPHIPDVGRDFDPTAFARAMREAHVNSVTVFAKCHHGHLYYRTQRPERHPGLRADLDLLGEQVEALHREGIRAPIYLSVQCDEYAANTHPEWIARGANGELISWKPGTTPFPFFQWQILDMNSGYQDYLADQLAEVLRTFSPVDGIFFDMCWDQPSLSHAAIKAMVAAGRNPDLESDRTAHAHQVALGYMRRFHQQVRAASPHAGVYFNSRPLVGLPEEKPYLGQVEIEALATGGWGYLYFPKFVRYARTFDRPYLGMTARFHKSWGDFGGLKPAAALEYETAQMLAHGAGCSIGDQLHPRGIPDAATYELIGRTYSRVAEREPWCLGATAMTDIGVYLTSAHAASTAYDGATRLLIQLKQQFDLVHRDCDLTGYRVIILPDGITLDDAAVNQIRSFVAQGGHLLISGVPPVGLDTGITACDASPFQHAYMQFGADIARDVPAGRHVCLERSLRLTPAAGTSVLGTWAEPYFDRTWQHFNSHCQTPDDRSTDYPLATLSAAAPPAGRVACIAVPVFTAYANHGNLTLRLLVRNVLDLLLPEPLLRITAPSSTEATVMRQHQHQRTVVHVLQYCPERRTKDLDLVEDVIPITDIPISVRCPHKPTAVYEAPSRTPLPFRWSNDRMECTVPRIVGHGMIIIE